MTIIYVKLIIWKRMSYYDVPVRYRPSVKKGLAQRGYKISGNRI